MPKVDVLRLQGAGPVNAFRCLGVAGNLDQFSFNQYLPGGLVELADERVQRFLLVLGGHDDQLAGADIRHYLAALVRERSLDRFHQVRRAGVFDLNDAGEKRWRRRGIFGGNAGNMGSVVFNKLQTIVVQATPSGLARR